MIYRPIDCWFKIDRDKQVATIAIEIEFKTSDDMKEFEDKSVKYEISGELLEKLGWLLVDAFEHWRGRGRYSFRPEIA